MREAIRVSVENIKSGGGPFGAVIVRDGEIIASSGNRVTANNDPTAHAEVMAIRAACQKLKTFDLSGTTIYTSCEPCPMCLGSIYWAHIDKMYYGNNRQDAAKIGFDDEFIYQEFERPLSERRLHTEQLIPNEAIEAFEAWENNADKIEY